MRHLFLYDVDLTQIMVGVVKEICSMLKESDVPVSYDDRHDACKVRKGGLTITSDGDALIIKNQKDTLFVVPNVKNPIQGIDLARGESVIRVESAAGTLVIAVPSTGNKYVRVAIELDLNKDGVIDGGAYRTFL